MKPYIASIINAVTMIALGLWGYYGSESPSFTALIPVASGILLIILNHWVKRENRIISHIVVILTLLIIAALFKPLTAATGRSDGMAIFRVSAMILSAVFAMIIFIRSFIKARSEKGK